MVYYIVPVLLLLAFWCPRMAINVSMQYNGGLPPDIIKFDVKSDDFLRAFFFSTSKILCKEV